MCVLCVSCQIIPIHLLWRAVLSLRPLVSVSATSMAQPTANSFSAASDSQLYGALNVSAISHPTASMTQPSASYSSDHHALQSTSVCSPTSPGQSGLSGFAVYYFNTITYKQHITVFRQIKSDVTVNSSSIKSGKISCKTFPIPKESLCPHKCIFQNLCFQFLKKYTESFTSTLAFSEFSTIHTNAFYFVKAHFLSVSFVYTNPILIENKKVSYKNGTVT